MYRALIVDDEVMILKGLQRIIDWSAYGFTVAGVASSGEEALTFLADQSVDFVLTDVTMPKMNGIDFVSQAFAQGNHFQFAILSGYNEFDYAKQSLQLGAVNYLMKPIDTQELAKTLTKVRKRLDSTEPQVRPQQQLLNGALHGQADPDHLTTLAQSSGFNDVDPNSYYLIAFVNLAADAAFNDYLISKNMTWFAHEGPDLYFLFIGSRWQADRLLVTLPTAYSTKTRLIVVSASASDLTTLPKRFSHMQQRITTAQFYDQMTGLIRMDDLTTTQEQHFPELDIGKIDQLVNDGHQDKLRDFIRTTLLQVAALNVDADYVRQVSFWFFATLNRRYYFSETYYNHQLELINQVTSFKKLLDLNLSWINQLRNDSGNHNYSPNVVAAIQYIYLNYHADINLSLAADQLYLNSMYLGQLFKTETGSTFNRFLNNYRIEQSKYLLRNTTQPVSEVGLAVGYSTASYFFRIFKQVTGVSPKEYRLK